LANKRKKARKKVENFKKKQKPLKKANIGQKVSEEQYRSAFQTSAVAMVIIENDTTISLANKQFEHLSGFRKDEIEGKKKWTEFIAKEDLERMKRYHRERRKAPDSAPKNYEFKFADRHKKIKNIFISVDMILGTDKSVASLLDITERKEREEDYKKLINGMNDTAFVINFDGKFIEVNDTAVELLGYSREELLRMGPADIDSTLNREDIKHLIEEVKMRQKQVFTTSHRTKYGEIIPVEVSSSLVTYHGNPAILGVVRNITERVKADKALKESEERFQLVIEGLPHGVSLLDLDGHNRLVNKALCDLTGYTKDELLKMTVSDIDPESLVRKDREKLWLKLEKGGVARVEATNYRKDGSSYPAEIYLNAIDFKGNPMILAIVFDITERKKSLEHLRQSEEKYRNLYESMMDAFVTLDMEGNIIEFNKQYLNMVGYTEDEIKNLKFTDLTPEKWHKMENEIFKEQILKKGYSDVYEKEYIKKDGTVFPVELRGFLIKDDKGYPKSIWKIVRDITERKKLEKELRKIDRLESLGILAGGIAHDFNNLLTGILGNLSLAELKEREEDIKEILEEAKQASIQAKNLTQQLLTFSKGGEPIKGEASIENIIKISAEFTLHGSNVKCVYDFPQDLWKVEVDKGQISQVIDNLVINAKQAMPEGGKIKIKAENFLIKSKNSLSLPEGKYLKIIVKDEGMGIPEKHLPRIFDPYFTTKQKGSGLGLATAYSIIKKHEGLITVESEIGKGTTFFIYLPAAKGEKKGKGNSETESNLIGKGRILVMDDEEIVRKTARGILKRLGYTIVLTGDGDEAIKKYREALDSGKPFNVVILDLTVPGGMGGKETIKKLRKIDPNIRAIVSSGYSTDPIMAHYEDYGFSAVVRKPYDVYELDKALKKVLG
jgi:PAS domain S-box-containing protein